MTNWKAFDPLIESLDYSYVEYLASFSSWNIITILVQRNDFIIFCKKVLYKKGFEWTLCFRFVQIKRVKNLFSLLSWVYDFLLFLKCSWDDRSASGPLWMNFTIYARKFYRRKVLNEFHAFFYSNKKSRELFSF